ncbi:MAG: sigma-70 family RNA polymerase sigma factor [Capnocytophaga sp.]|nr:sigma-70 family RNA polymerase sigma factor [Capnocytophaga sp.]
MNATKDKEILDTFTKGDKVALQLLFDVYYKPLCVYSVQFTESLSDSEDVVQELFIRFWEKQLYKNIAFGLRAYLFQSVRNESLRFSKKTHLHPLLDEIELLSHSPIDEVYDEEELVKRNAKIRTALEQLSPQEYNVLTEIVLNGKRYKDVASQLEISVNTVKTHLRRAMKSLRSKSFIICIIQSIL